MTGAHDLIVVSGRWPRTHLRSAENHFAYCVRHGYRYAHFSVPTREHAYFHKIEFISHHLRSADWLLWVDDDVFFVDFDLPLEASFSFDAPILELPGRIEPDGELRVCSGQMLLRSGERTADFLSRVTSAALKNSVETGQIDPSSKNFTGGDQDVIQLLASSEFFSSDVKIQNWEIFNGRFEDLLVAEHIPGVPQLPPIVHFTGQRSTKHRNVRRAARLLSRGPDLIPFGSRPWEANKATLLGRLWRTFLDRGLIPAAVENAVLNSLSRIHRGK